MIPTPLFHARGGGCQERSEILVIPGLGLRLRARNPGTQASANLGRAGVHRFRAWSRGPSRNDKEVSAHWRHFLTAAKEGGCRWPYSCRKNRNGPARDRKSTR